jgi:hypothetical protein
MARLAQLITQLRRNNELYVVFVPRLWNEWWGAFTPTQFAAHPPLTTSDYFTRFYSTYWDLDGRVITHIGERLGHAVRDPGDVRTVLRRFRRIRSRGWDLTISHRGDGSWEPVLIRPPRPQAARLAATSTDEGLAEARIIPASDPDSAPSAMPKSSQVPTRFEREDPFGEPA